MSFFSKIFGEDKPSENNWAVKWNYLTSEGDLEDAIKRSHEVPVAIFKHSTRCFISQSVLRSFENDAADYQGPAELYFLDLLSYRTLSNRIASELHVTHQSPQLIVLKDGKAVENASHNAISVNLLP